jgi:glycosyltransferase involved in cell wall biosynthesis
LTTPPKLIRITTVPMALRYLLPGQMRFMKENGFEVLMISADGKERQDVISNEGCEHIIVPMTRKITPIQDLKCLWQLIKIFKKEKPDIVHTHTPKAGLLGMLAAKICAVKVRIHTVAGLPLMVETGFKFQLLKAIEKITYWSANHVWPNSFSLLNFIKENKFTKDKKLNVINKGSSNGIDLKRFNTSFFDEKILNEIKIDINFNTDNLYLVCIGRLVKDKGIVELVEAFQYLKKSRTNLKLILVGIYEGHLDPLPENTISEINNDADIIHIAWSDHVEYYISLANLFLFPSHREGFPNVLLQSGALGIPIICSSIAGNIDIVQHEKTGLLFPVGDRIEMQKQINFALDNESKINEMANLLKQNINNSFAKEKIWDSILKEYKMMLQKNGR